MRPKWVSKDPVLGVQIHDGQHIQFENGRYETADPEEISYIKGLSEFGSRVTSIEPGDLAAAKGPEVVTGSMGAGSDPGKRRFKCLRCGMDGFESGFEIAQHRKNGECDQIQAASQPEPEENLPEEGLNTSS